ncbi:TIGR03759 family integrating conjugative element protein [Photobacterium leiognathi]|uniref:TIGR03759 family integrating conjugative element protein n=1 Tax=Photobacterium leiognathi TaxID=553611 RepID=UPI00273934D9|nr:TIGR03759 family integrating conjugative element protein [Photobacterium leiognathi]
MIKQAYFLMFFFVSTATFAKEERIVHDKTVSDTIVHQQQNAQRFGLSLKEWQRYENVMQSSLGWEMQKSHPIAVLGRTAETADERSRYAIMLVQHEKKLAEGLLAFARARTEAWKQLYPDLPIIADSTPDRVALFVSSECKNCEDVLRQWRRQGVNVDIHFVGAKNDNVLRTWAMKAGIRKSDVDKQFITLNHDKGHWFTLAKRKPMPVSMAKNKEGVWQFIEPLS